jgi:two-component system, NarL family, response regulator NreC
MNRHREINSGGTATEKDMDVKRIKVVLAEEQQNYKDDLRLLLASEPDIDVIGEVNNGFDALDMIGNLHPDILILGLCASNTLEIVQLVNHRFPNTAIIVPRKGDNENRILEMMRAGVKIYVLKTSAAAKFVNTIREVCASQIHSNSSVSEINVGKAARYLKKTTVDPYEVLTKREHEVFSLVVSGLTNAMIADRLSISQRTVEIHRANMLRKLGLRNQHEQLVKYAIERKILLDTDENK